MVMVFVVELVVLMASTLGLRGGECHVIPPVHWKGVAPPQGT